MPGLCPPEYNEKWIFYYTSELQHLESFLGFLVSVFWTHAWLWRQKHRGNQLLHRYFGLTSFIGQYPHQGTTKPVQYAALLRCCYIYYIGDKCGLAHGTPHQRETDMKWISLNLLAVNRISKRTKFHFR